MDAIGRPGPVVSDPSEIHYILCLVVSDSSGGVGLVCGMKRGISRSENLIIKLESVLRTICKWIDSRGS